MRAVKFDFEFRGETASHHGIYIQKRPDMPAGREEVEYITVAGRDSPLAVKTGERKNVEITLSCGFRENKNDWNAKARKLRKWLDGEGELSFTDSPRSFWKVKNVELDEFTRTIKRLGNFDVTFICEPFEYIKEGKREKEIQEVKYNLYDTSKPVYKITGNGSCSLTVNGKIMKATVGQNLTIDTERMLAYREDGTMVNTSVTGDYEDLYLQPGENEISITSGFGLVIIPNWRCL